MKCNWSRWLLPWLAAGMLVACAIRLWWTAIPMMTGGGGSGWHIPLAGATGCSVWYEPAAKSWRFACYADVRTCRILFGGSLGRERNGRWCYNADGTAWK